MGKKSFEIKAVEGAASQRYALEKDKKDRNKED
jgi:hypothetical protein